MNLLENIRLAWEGLKANKMRALLTMLGIIIGIASVIGILTVGDGMSGAVTSSLGSLGASNIAVQVCQRDYEEELTLEPADRITDDMLNALLARYPDAVAGVSIEESIGTGQVRDGRDYANVSVIGVSAGYTAVENLDLLRGRGIEARDLEGGRSVAVVSDHLVGKLFGGDADAALGQEISATVGDAVYTFRIIGVYEYEATEMYNTSEADLQTSVYIPLTTAKRLAGRDAGYAYLTVQAADGVDSAAFADEIRDFLGRYYEKNADWTIDTMSMQSILDEMNTLMSTISIALSVIAGISLLVGGIGVMNIMLVSVTERTREIGTRKALGATNGNIRVQFVVESMIVCLFGGMIGVVLGTALGYAGSNLMGYAALPSFGSILLAFGFSLAIGVFFGYYPANKAAKLDPIEALRYE